MMTLFTPTCSSPNAPTMATMQHPPPTHTHHSNTTTTTTTQPSSTILTMDKLKSLLIQRLTKLQPNNTLSPSLFHSIQLHLQHAFPSFYIPTHPTYSTMIEKAIEELNEEDGSSEEAISDYILANYEGLPWAHKRFLSYYLDKLCKANEVMYISSNRYSIPRLMDNFSRKKKRLRLSSRRIRKVHLSEVDKSDENKENVNMALFQEDSEEAGVLLEYSAKRRGRNSRVVEDDEEEVVEGTEIVEIQNNVVENTEVQVNNRVEAETKDGTNENLGDSALACDPCERKGEGLVLNVDKTPPGKHEALISDYTIGGANVMLLPFVSMEKREIVCCLYVPQLEQPKTRRVKKLKRCREKKSTISATPTAFLHFTKGAKLGNSEGLNEHFPTRANSMKLDPKLLESPQQSQQGHKSPAFGSNLMICDVEGFVEHEHGKQKLHLDSSPSSFQSELMLMEDGDLNTPLKQVLKMHGKRIKTSTTHRKRKLQMLHYDGQPHELVENEQIKGGHVLSHDAGQYDINPLLESPSVKPSSPSHRYLEDFQGLLPDLKACSRSLESSAEDVAASKSLNGWRKRSSESGIHQKSDRITTGERNGAVFLNLHDQWKEGPPLEPATCKAKKKDGRGRPRKITEKTIEDVPPPLDLFSMRQKELAQAVICESKNKDGENLSRQSEPVMTQDVGVVTVKSTHDQSHERPSEQAIEGLPVQATHQIKKQWESEAEVYEAPSEFEQVTNISDDVALVVDQPRKQEERRRSPIEKQRCQSRSHLKVEQKLNNHIPPSLPTRRSSRINRKYQIGILTCKP